ncbi:MAG: CatB-related O-acetyltransferase [Alphaproteobacteria bacterium]|nr:CatB-related O-acetyltransferase [Alphaproteobacteria bacterium]
MKKIIRKLVTKSIPEIQHLLNQGNEYNLLSWSDDTTVGKNVLLYPLYHISESSIGDYTYIAQNSFISMTTIGKFCSIGPNLVCGWGIHPTDGISTSPMFYSTREQNGITLSNTDKIEERKPISIGNDVFIGANVTVLDGVTIGDGAIIGAGAVVSKYIPPYAIAVGCPIKIIRYRFDEEKIKALRKIEWWNFDEEKLKQVEKLFFDVELFIQKNSQL